MPARISDPSNTILGFPFRRKFCATSFVILMAAASQGIAQYQPVYTVPTTTTATTPSSGYAAPAPAYTLGGPVVITAPAVGGANAGQVWQTYPTPGGVTPEFSTASQTQAGNPVTPLQAPIFPSTPEPGQTASLLPPGTRSGVFQKVNFSAAWLPQLDDESLGWTDLRSEVVFGLPFFTRETPIVITPAYEAHFLDRPGGFDLPPRLHDLSIDLHHFRRIGDQWIADFAVTPGIYADDHSFDSTDAFRINGRALAIYESAPAWKWIAGVTYVNGAWAKVVPVAGVVYEPNDDVAYRLVFPSPKISWRLPYSLIPGQDEYWFYTAAEFANAIWAFEQSNGTPDLFASRDYRVLFGLEHKVIGGVSSHIEAGYVFNRTIKLASGPGDIDLDDTLMVRAGLSY